MMKTKSFRHAKNRRFFSMNKKGVSPLIATVLLIAFAVALGTVVMNWGKAFMATPSQKECGLVHISWYQRDGNDQLCYSSSSIVFTIENGADAEIEGIKLVSDGTRDIFKKEETLDKPMAKADIAKVSVEYDKSAYGAIEQLRLIPKVKVKNEVVICSSQALIKNNPKSC